MTTPAPPDRNGGEHPAPVDSRPTEVEAQEYRPDDPTEEHGKDISAPGPESVREDARRGISRGGILGAPSWIRVLFVASVVVGLVAVWYHRHGRPPILPSAEEISLETKLAIPFARSAEYRFPASWLNRISPRTWSMLWYPPSWRLAVDLERCRLKGWSDSSPLRALPSGRNLTFGRELGFGSTIPLQGLWAHRDFVVGIPDTWHLVHEPQLLIDLEISPALLPELSVFAVSVDGQPAGSIRYSDIVDRRTIVFPMPLARGRTLHTLGLTAYHRTQVECEEADDPDRWTHVLGTSAVRAFYEAQPPFVGEWRSSGATDGPVVAADVEGQGSPESLRPGWPEPDLARWPYPFVDRSNPDPFEVVLVLPPDPTASEILVMGRVVAMLGKETARIPMETRRPVAFDVHVGDPGEAPPGHVIAITRSSPATAPQATVGIRPTNPLSAILAFAAPDDSGFAKLAAFLGNHDTLSLASGERLRLDAADPPDPEGPRGSMYYAPPEPVFNLTRLGLGDLTARGFQGGIVEIPLHHRPDENVVAGRAWLELTYGVSSQLDRLSRLRVNLDDTTLAVHAIDPSVGRHHVSVELPGPRVRHDSKVRVHFDLLGKESSLCMGAYHTPLWGTVFADSVVVLPRVATRRPHDLSHLRAAGYPFGIHADLSEMDFVLPRTPKAPEIGAMMALAAEFGRVTPDEDMLFGVRLGDDEDGRIADQVIISEAGRSEALTRRDRPFSLLRESHAAPVGDISLRIGKRPHHSDRSVLKVTSTNGDAFTRLARCSGRRAHLFERIRGPSAIIPSCPETGAPGPGAQVVPPSAFRPGLWGSLANHYWIVLLSVVTMMCIGLAFRTVRRDARNRRRGAASHGE